MNKYIFWSLITAISLAYTYLIKYEPYRQQFGDDFQFSLIGHLFGLLFLPLLATYVVLIFRKIFKAKKDNNTFIKIYFGFWLIVLFSTVIGDYERSKGEASHVETENNFVYDGKNGEYYVTFTSKPEISRNIIPGTSLSSETAQLVIPEAETMLRAESIVFENELKNAKFDRQLIEQIIDGYITTNGLTYPELKYSETELGQKAEVRAFKTLQDQQGVERNLTYGLNVYFGENSVLILTGASSSSKYPTPQIIRFFDSAGNNR